MIPILIKFILIAAVFLAGAIFVMRSIGGTDVFGGLTSKTANTKGLEDLDIIDTVSRVLPAISEIPSLVPIISTKNNIQRSVEGIINLPAEEKAAFCKQVCSK